MNFWGSLRVCVIGYVGFTCLDPRLCGSEVSGFLGAKRGGLEKVHFRARFHSFVLAQGRCLK